MSKFKGGEWLRQRCRSHSSNTMHISSDNNIEVALLYLERRKK